MKYMAFHLLSEVSLEPANVVLNHVFHAADRFCMSFKDSLGEDYSKVGTGGFNGLQQRSLKNL